MLVTERKPPIIIPATFTPSDPAHSTALIFLHGLGDDAAGLKGLSLLLYLFSKFPIFHPRIILKLSGIARQYQLAKKLPCVKWIFPSALEHRNAVQTAWCTPTPLSPFPSSCPEPNNPEDEDGMKFSIAYMVTLIDDLVSQGIPEIRIVLGGFSQGCAMTLFTGLTSKYAGKLAGLVGYLGTSLPQIEYPS